MKTLKKILRWILASGMISAGINHFISPNFYLRMMPPALPAPLFLIYLSGIIEIALGGLLLIPKFSRLAAWGLIALFVAVYPANLYMAMNSQLFPEFSSTTLYIRPPLQIVLIVWAYWMTKTKN